MQEILAPEQIESFYHDLFVMDQVRDFFEMLPAIKNSKYVVDVGGGCGFFASKIKLTHKNVRVIDLDQKSVDVCLNNEVEAILGDALNPKFSGDEEIACFNLILHHLVGKSELLTKTLQLAALNMWKSKANFIFVNEYIYESYIKNLSGRIIYTITSSKVLSFVGRIASLVVPSFRANTFGVGVRFRSHLEWRTLFESSGFNVLDFRQGKPEVVSFPLRVLLIKEIRRDSFLLISKS